MVAAAGLAVFVGLRRRRRHVPDDLGRRLVELFGEMGDVLSEYQDVVAGEAYLGTRRRGLDVTLRFGDGAHAAGPSVDLERIATYRTGSGGAGRGT